MKGVEQHKQDFSLYFPSTMVLTTIPRHHLVVSYRHTNA